MNNIQEFDLKSAEKMVRRQRAAGNDVEWNGWELVFYRPADNARQSVHGVWRNNQWAFANRVQVNDEGIYKVDGRNLKRTRGPRNRSR